MTDDELKTNRLGTIHACCGKTIAAALETCGDGFILRFTDGTWIGGEGQACDYCDGIDFDRRLFAIDMHCAGLLDDFEYEVAANAEKQRELNRRREQYEQLKAEFESK